jgi:hypothetical protein
MAVRRLNFKRWTAKTCLYKLNPPQNRVKLWRTLPSAGDTSYAGLVEKDQTLYVSYYSSHKDAQANVYLAAIPLIRVKPSRRFR